MNGIEVVLSPKSMCYLLKHDEVVFSYMGCLYKVKKLPKGDIYRLYIHNAKRSPKSPREWSYLMNIEEPVCLEEGFTPIKEIVHDELKS